jgi:hypothetical protein
MRFTYRSGQRPLDGYTIKRGVGQGGFGEVYFAVSDGGKEVALKLLRGHSDIEMRGVANCLNLKHPNLVHIYDLKTDSHGDKWLIMEYVLGESLAQVIDRHPHGLPIHLAAEWFQCLARAVSYLHDHGVVHRDLKPANVFVENSNLKVGDYGLCKAMSASGRQQTQTVGTVHYMAPEVSTGNYTRSIDIYACGVILHEMLTGKPPFDGETDGEILMKHLTATPNLVGVPDAFQPIIEKALDKNPLRRFSTMTEMARAVEAAYPTQGGPVPLPAAKPIGESKADSKFVLPAPPVAPPGTVVANALPVAAVVPPPPPAATSAPTMIRPAAAAHSQPSGEALRDRLMDLTGAMVKAPLIAAGGVLAWSLATATTEWVEIGKLFLVTVGVCWAVLAASSGVRLRVEDGWGRRLRLAGLGVAIGTLTFWLDGWLGGPFPVDVESHPEMEQYLLGTFAAPPESVSVFMKYVLYFGCVMGACRWWRMAAKDRKERFSLAGPIAAAFWGLVLLFLWPWESQAPAANALVPLIVAAVAVQWVSPWSPPPPPAPKRLRWKAVGHQRTW